VPPSDLERDAGDLPGPPRHGQGPVDPADLEHEDPGRAELDGAAERDRVHDAAVEVVLVADLGRRQQPGYGGARDDRVDDAAGVEPVLRGPLDAGRAHLEPDRQLLERQVAELVLEGLLQRLRRPQVGAGADRATHGAQRAVAVHLGAGACGGAPHLGELLDHRELGLAGDEGTVQGADAGAEDQLGPDVALEQRSEHPDLDRAEDAAAAKHERSRHARPRGMLTPASVPPGRGARHGPAPSRGARPRS
jgi:hypothetical protein